MKNNKHLIKKIIYSILAILLAIGATLSNYDNETSRKISAVALILFAITFIIGLCNEFLTHKQINKELETDSLHREKMTILGTYPNSNYLSNYNKMLKLVLILIIILVLFISAMLYFISKYPHNDISYITPLLTTVLVVLGAAISINKWVPKKVLKHINEMVTRKHKDAIVNKLKLVQYEYKNSIKYKKIYRYEIIVNKYSCKVVNYFVFKRTYNHNTYISSYEAVQNVLEYEYHLNEKTNLNITIDSESNDYNKYALNDQLENNINELRKSRMFEIEISDDIVKIKNYIKISNLLNATTDKEIDKSINDIEEFYHKIVECLKKDIKF